MGKASKARFAARCVAAKHVVRVYFSGAGLPCCPSEGVLFDANSQTLAGGFGQGFGIVEFSAYWVKRIIGVFWSMVFR